jgi:hypothetical protein
VSVVVVVVDQAKAKQTSNAVMYALQYVFDDYVEHCW